MTPLPCRTQTLGTRPREHKSDAALSTEFLEPRLGKCIQRRREAFSHQPCTHTAPSTGPAVSCPGPKASGLPSRCHPPVPRSLGRTDTPSAL